MEYINSDRVLCNKNETVKWVVNETCTLPEVSGFSRVYDYAVKQFRQQATDKASWNTYLVSIGKLKLSPYQKINSAGDIVIKTIDELYSDGVISNDEYKHMKPSEIKEIFETACIKEGVAFSGVFNMLSGVTVNNPKFQYDKDSWQLLESVVDDARVGYWRSLNNQNIVLTNQDKHTLLELMKLTYFTKFAESRAAIDAL